MQQEHHLMNTLVCKSIKNFENNALLSSLFDSKETIPFRAIDSCTGKTQSFKGEFEQVYDNLKAANKLGFSIFLRKWRKARVPKE